MEGYFYPAYSLTHTILANTVTGVCSHGWCLGALQSELGLASWHAVLAVLKFLIASKAFDVLRIPQPSPGLPLAGNCILSTATPDKWGGRGAAHCHQPTWHVSHCNLQCVSCVCLSGDSIHVHIHMDTYVDWSIRTCTQRYRQSDMYYNLPKTHKHTAYFICLILASDKDITLQIILFTLAACVSHLITSWWDPCYTSIDIVWECWEIIQLKRTRHTMGTPVEITWRWLEIYRMLPMCVYAVVLWSVWCCV